MREALEAQSRKDFIAKHGIALKEAVETEYWLELLFETGYILKPKYDDLKKDIREIVKILNTIIKTTKQRTDA